MDALAVKAIKEAYDRMQYYYGTRSFATLRKPRIISIRQIPFPRLSFTDSAEIKADARFALRDDAVKLFTAWAFIAPAVPLAVLLWIRYPALRLAAIALLFFSVLQFAFGLSIAGFALSATDLI